MNPHGRIVNVSSANGELQHFGSQSLQARFRDPDITLQDIEQLAQEYEVGPCTDAYTNLPPPPSQTRTFTTGVSSR